MSSIVSAPGPVPSMTFLKSSSDQLFGTLPMNNLYLVSDSEHLMVFPWVDDKHTTTKKLPNHALTLKETIQLLKNLK